MSDEVTIRPATNADCAAVRQLVADVLAEYQLRSDPSGTDADIADIETNYLSAGGAFEVVESAGQVVGSLGLYPQGERTCELRKMYLRPEVRGRGVGRLLLTRALERAIALGFRRIELETSQVLREALSLYREFGFRPVTGERLSSRCDIALALDLEAEG